MNTGIEQPVNHQMDDTVYDEINALITEGIEEPKEATPTDDPIEPIESQELPDSRNKEMPEKAVDEDPDVAIDTEDEVDEEIKVDYEVMVPFADGRDAMSVGQMKDMINGFEREKDAVGEDRMALIAQETELNQYMQHMGVQVSPEFQKHMAAKQHDYLEEQHGLMLKMMPELKNKQTFEGMRTNIVGVAKASNFSAEEISQISDARVIHLLNRLANLEAKDKAAHENVERIRKKSGPKGVVKRNVGKKSVGERQFNDAIKSNDRGVKDAAIAALLG